MTSAARKVVLHARVAYDRTHDALLQRLLDRKIALFCAVGVDCGAWEDAMDWMCIGPDGEIRGFVVTSSHPDESLAEVVAFAEAWTSTSRATSRSSRSDRTLAAERPRRRLFLHAKIDWADRLP